MATKMASRLAVQKRACTFPYNYCDINMDQAYPCPATKRSPPTPTAATGHSLPNGTRVVSQDNGAATSLVSVAIDAGSIYDAPGKEGTADFLSKMSFRSNLQSSDFHVFKTFQHAGANYWSNQVGRRFLTAKVECRRDTVEDVMKRLVEGAFIPRFSPHEMKLERETLETAVVTAKHDGKTFTMNLFNKLAFNGTPLSTSGMCPAHNVDHLTHDDLIQHWASHFTPKRVIIGGVNVSQDELIAAYNRAEWNSANSDSNPSHADAAAAAATPKGAYTGGSDSEYLRRSETFLRQQFYDDVFIAYGRKGNGSANIQEFAAQLVAAGSVGGPIGTGFGFEGVVRAYPDVSVVGGIVRCRPEAADGAARCLASSVNSVASLSGATLDAAKKVATVSFLSSVNTREGLLDFLTEHASAEGLGKTVPDVVAAISAVTEADMKKLGDVMQSADATYCSLGDLKSVPSLKAL